MGTPHAGMICHELESVRDGEWDVRDTVIGGREGGWGGDPVGYVLMTI